MLIEHILTGLAHPTEDLYESGFLLPLVVVVNINIISNKIASLWSYYIHISKYTQVIYNGDRGWYCQISKWLENLNKNLAASRIREILRWDVRQLSEARPWRL